MKNLQRNPIVKLCYLKLDGHDGVNKISKIATDLNNEDF